MVAGLLLMSVACSASPAGTDGAPVDPGDATSGTGVPGTDGGVPGGPPGTATRPPAPVVAPESVEAFCALSDQLEQLGDEQMGAVPTTDPEALRQAFATFFTDNTAVIDQYVAAAPPEIEGDVDAVIGQGRSAVEDPERFGDALRDTAASNRVSDFIDANCP